MIPSPSDGNIKTKMLHHNIQWGLPLYHIILDLLCRTFILIGYGISLVGFSCNNGVIPGIWMIIFSNSFCTSVKGIDRVVHWQTPWQIKTFCTQFCLLMALRFSLLFWTNWHKTRKLNIFPAFLIISKLILFLECLQLTNHFH